MKFAIIMNFKASSMVMESIEVWEFVLENFLEI